MYVCLQKYNNKVSCPTTLRVYITTYIHTYMQAYMAQSSQRLKIREWCCECTPIWKGIIEGIKMAFRSYITHMRRCIHMCIRIHVYIYVYIYTYMWMYIKIEDYFQKQLKQTMSYFENLRTQNQGMMFHHYICEYVYMFTTFRKKHVCTLVSVDMYIYIYIYIYTHTCI